MATTYDTSAEVTMDTKALIFRDGQVDEFGRVWPLALFGRTHDGRSRTLQRNIHPSLHSVRSALRRAESSSCTHLEIGGDGCG